MLWVIVGKRIRYHDPLNHPSSRGARGLRTEPGVGRGVFRTQAFFLEWSDLELHLTSSLFLLVFFRLSGWISANAC